MFIFGQKCTTLVNDVDNWGGTVYGGIWGISEPSSQFCYKSKTAAEKLSLINILLEFPTVETEVKAYKHTHLCIWTFHYICLKFWPT